MKHTLCQYSYKLLGQQVESVSETWDERNRCGMFRHASGILSLLGFCRSTLETTQMPVWRNLKENLQYSVECNHIEK